MSVVRIGVLGAGLIGKKHIAVLLANEGNYELVGVADPDLDAAKRCLLYTSPSPRDVEESRMPSSA